MKKQIIETLPQEGSKGLSQEAVDFIIENKIESLDYYGDYRAYYCHLPLLWGEESGLYEVLVSTNGNEVSEITKPQIEVCGKLKIIRQMEAQSFTLESEQLKLLFQNFVSDLLVS